MAWEEFSHSLDPNADMPDRSIPVFKIGPA